MEVYLRRGGELGISIHPELAVELDSNDPSPGWDVGSRKYCSQDAVLQRCLPITTFRPLGAGRGYRMYFMRPLEPASARDYFDGRIYHGGPARLRKAATSESTATDQRVTVGSAAALKPCSRTAIGRRAGQKLSKYPKSLLRELASENANAVSSEMVARAYAARDPAAVEVIRETLDLLAYWLGSIIDLLEPESS